MQAEDAELDAMLGDLDDPELEVGLDPELGEGGEEERILGGRGKAAEEGSKGPGGGKGGAKTFKEFHKRLVELKVEEGEESGEEDGGEENKDKVGWASHSSLTGCCKALCKLASFDTICTVQPCAGGSLALQAHLP